jgi:hypothetical protein
VTDFSKLLVALTRHVVENNMNACAFRECGKFSVGAVCSTCSRYVCLHHAYVRVQLPPRKPLVLCAACVILEHEDLLREDPSEA